mmetsp:Transcript_37423/g.50795  ORF Transcript_37423/g.50795 Transcript_37423/m.50795 type:complete len:105 (+) Transcript_37423:101-415(+)
MMAGDPAFDHLRTRIASSQFLDLHFCRDQSSPYPFMMPSLGLFANTMRALQIRKSDLVVIYDDNNGWFASRAVFMLKAFGHENVKLLDGGLKKWKSDNYSIYED